MLLTFFSIFKSYLSNYFWRIKHHFQYINGLLLLLLFFLGVFKDVIIARSINYLEPFGRLGIPFFSFHLKYFAYRNRNIYHQTFLKQVNPQILKTSSLSKKPTFTWGWFYHGKKYMFQAHFSFFEHAGLEIALIFIIQHGGYQRATSTSESI